LIFVFNKSGKEQQLKMADLVKAIETEGQKRKDSLKKTETVDKSAPVISPDVKLKTVDRDPFLTEVAGDHTLKHVETVDKSGPAIPSDVQVKKHDRGGLLKEIETKGTNDKDKEQKEKSIKKRNSLAEQKFETVFRVFKQSLIETIGPKNWKAIGGEEYEITNSPEIEAALRKLVSLHNLYSEISLSLSNYLNAVKNLSQTEESLYWTISEIAVHEEDPGLREELSSFGEVHKHLNKAQKGLTTAYQTFNDHVNTYFQKAIADCMVTAKKYNSLRLEYDAFKAKLVSLEHDLVKGTSPKLEKEIEMAKIQVEEAKGVYVEMSMQLTSKIEVLYNLKIQNLKEQIRLCKKATEQYLSDATSIFEIAEKEH